MSRLTIAVCLLLLCARPGVQAGGEESDKMTYEYIPSLLRFNRAGSVVSSDISEYLTYSCRYKGDSDLKTCSANIDEQDFRDALDKDGTNPDDDSTVSYLEGVAMYAAINFVGFVILVLLVALYLIYALVTCCCSCSSARPTKTHPRWRFLIAYGCMLFTLVFLSVVAILGHTLGGSQLTEGIVEASDSAGGVQTMVQKSVYPVQQVVVNTLSSVLVPAFVALNRTVFGAIDIGRLCNDTQLVNDVYNDLNIVPYVRRTFDDLSRRGVDLLEDVEREIDEIVNNLNNLTDQAHGMVDQIEETNDSLENMTQVLRDVIPLLEDLNVEAGRLEGPSASTGQTGLVGSVLDDLETISRDESPPYGLGFPLASTYSSAASGSVSSVEGLQHGSGQSLNGSSANIEVLNGKLVYIHDLMELLPDYEETGDNLVEINRTLNEMLGDGGLMDQLEEQVQLVAYYQSLIPSGDELKEDVADFFDSAYTLSLSDLRVSILDLDDFLTDVLDPFRVIREKLVALDLGALVAPLHHLMVVQSNIVSTELYDLTGLYNSSKDYLPLEKEILDSIDILDDVVSGLDDAIETLEQVNVTEYVRIVDEITTSLNTTLNAVDTEELYRLLDDYSDATASVNASRYVDEISQVRGSMSAVYIPPVEDILPALQMLETEKDTTIAALQRAIGTDITVPTVTGTRDGDYTLLALGICSDDTDQYCSDDADCAGSCKHKGVYRCAASGLGSPFSLCSQDSDCGVNSYCLNSQARANALRIRLEIFAVDTLLDATTSRTDEVSGLADLRIQEIFNVSSAADTINDALDILDEVDLAEYIDLVQDVLDDLVTGTLVDINTTLVDAKRAIDEFDFNEYNQTLKDVQKIVEDLGEYFPDAVLTCFNLRDFIYNEDGMRSHFEYFSESNLLSLVDESGPGGMVTAALRRVDVIGGIFREMFINFTTLDRLTVASDGQDFSRSLNRVSGHPRSGHKDIYQHGSIYFLTQLYNQSKDKTISAHDPIAHNLYEGSDGKRYEDNQWCVTRECFSATKEDLEEEPIVEDSSVDTSFQAIVGYVWVMPFIAVFFGIVTMLCPMATTKPWARRAPATCMLFCVICQLGPFLLLTGLFFPFVILAADGCNSSTSIAQGVVKAYGDELCSDMDGTGGLRSCTFNTYNLSVTVDPYGAFSGVLGDCNSDLDGGPYGGPLKQIAAQLRREARKKAYRKLHGEYYEDLEIYRLNRTLEDIGLDAVENVAGVVASFLEDIGEEVVPCSQVSEIKDQLIYPMCTSTVGALGWYLGCLYLMAWSLCCLGIPAGCCVQYENEQRQKEYDAYIAAFDSEDGDSEQLDEENSEDASDCANEKRMAMPAVSLEEGEQSGAYGAVFGAPSAPPRSYYDDGDGVEMTIDNERQI